MPVTSVTETDTFIEINIGGRILRLDYGDIPGNGFNQNRLNKARDRLQAFLDQRVRQDSLPLDDPERNWSAADFTAAYGGRRFLDGSDIVDREILIEAVTMHANGLWPVARLTRSG